MQATELGTRDGGAFETPYLWVATGEGLVGVEDGFDLYDLDQIDQARARFAELGIEGDAPVGVYCGSGMAAAHEVAVLTSLGIPAKLFVGSFSAWSADPTRPIATGDA